MWIYAGRNVAEKIIGPIVNWFFYLNARLTSFVYSLSRKARRNTFPTVVFGNSFLNS